MPHVQIRTTCTNCNLFASVHPTTASSTCRCTFLPSRRDKSHRGAIQQGNTGSRPGRTVRKSSRRLLKALGSGERSRVRIHGPMLLLVRHEAGEEIYGQRKDDGGILLGGDGVQCLKVTQLQGGRA